jgi:hypothetical protein
MRFDPVAAAFALIGFVVVAFAPSPSWESIGAGAACALVALVVRLRPVRRTKGSPVQGRSSALPQQMPPSLPTSSGGFQPGARSDQPHAALLMPVQAVTPSR